MKKDQLGDRMKAFYEDRTRYYLPRKTYCLIRIDGKAFHTFTKGLKAPFDESLIEAMNMAAEAICAEAQGAKFAYVQSDEISVVLTDFDTVTTDAWFDYNIQKICSVAASVVTRAFNFAWMHRYYPDDLAVHEMNRTVASHFNDPDDVYNYHITPGDITNYLPNMKEFAMFDARVWSMNSREEVLNYFLWRQQDAVRNSVASVAQHHFSHKELHGKNQKDQILMLSDINDPWDAYPADQKRGRVIVKEEFERNGAMRSHWVARPAHDFLNKEPLRNLLPAQYQHYETTV